MKKQLLLVTVVLASCFTSVCQPVVVGTGTAISVYSPLNRSNDYSVYEVIYLASEINTSGPINAISFERVDGTNTDSIENVSIYLQHTTQTNLTSGNFSTAGYSLVFTGKWPNNGIGWQEQITDSMFTYNGTDNLKVLVVKDYQPAIANTPVAPRWYYTNISGATRARRYYGNIALSASTALSTTNFTSNIRLTFGTVGVIDVQPQPLSVYPNPSQGNITFDFGSFAPSILHISNSMGQQVYFNNHVESDKINISQFAKGVYFYDLMDKTGTLTKGKFIVQ